MHPLASLLELDSLIFEKIWKRTITIVACTQYQYSVDLTPNRFIVGTNKLAPRLLICLNAPCLGNERIVLWQLLVSTQKEYYEMLPRKL
jgi:hypothetical protein